MIIAQLAEINSTRRRPRSACDVRGLAVNSTNNLYFYGLEQHIIRTINFSLDILEIAMIGKFSEI